MAKEKVVPEEAPQAVAPEAGKIVDAWFVEWFHNYPDFSSNALLWGRLQAAKQDLIKILQEGK